MLRVIRDANDSVARFKEVTAESSTPKEKQAAKAETPADKDGKPAKAEAAAAATDEKKVKPAAAAARTDSLHKLFRNPYWELDLTLAGSETGKYVLRGKLTNISKRKQDLDVKFKVFLQDPSTADEPSSELISLDGLPI